MSDRGVTFSDLADVASKGFCHHANMTRDLFENATVSIGDGGDEDMLLS